MRAYSLKKAKQMVELYNSTCSAHKVAETMQLPLPDVKKIMRWLHKHDPKNKEAIACKTNGQFVLKAPDSRIWVQFLYTHDIPAHTAASCCNWPLQRVLESCGGPDEWVKTGGRRAIKLHENDVNGGREVFEQRDKDPSAEEIEARKREIQADWAAGNCSTRGRGGEPKTQPRVEARQYVYDNRSGRFSEM